MLAGDTQAAAARARDLGIPFEGTPGPLNAITDVRGVEVGQKTLIEGEGPLKVGVGPVRTGVTVGLPARACETRAVYGGFFDLNGNGEMTGRAYLEDFGIVQGPIGLSDTNAVGQVYAGIQQWTAKRSGSGDLAGRRRDLERLPQRHRGLSRHRRRLQWRRSTAPRQARSRRAMSAAGPEWSASASRAASAPRPVSSRSLGKSYTVGVLVQCNTGDRKVLRIAGAPAGQALAKRWLRCFDAKRARWNLGELAPVPSRTRRDRGSRSRLNHHRRRHRRAVDAVAAEPGRSPSGDGPCSPGLLFRQSVRRSDCQLLDGCRAGSECRGAGQAEPNLASWKSRHKLTPRYSKGGDRGDRGGDRQRSRGRDDDDGHQWHSLFTCIPHDELRAILKRYNRLERLRQIGNLPRVTNSNTGEDLSGVHAYLDGLIRYAEARLLG